MAGSEFLGKRVTHENEMDKRSPEFADGILQSDRDTLFGLQQYL